ncbi:TVP38/TMEM64 family protein [Vibrio tritonius]|uniref:TVP38/TMEM64 family protein n=1 Tax=Vibrio tritonius TaxID=1435069 RepID=UPI00315D26AB
MKLLKIVFLCALCVLIYSESDSDIWMHIADKNWIANYIANDGIRGLAILLTFGAIFTACGGPRQLIAFTFGFTFGSVLGVVFCLLSAITGAVCTYALAAWIFRDSLTRRLGKRYKKFKGFVDTQPFSKVLLLRIFPLGSNLITNLLSGITGVPIISFIAASLLGYLPQTIIFVLAGSGIGSASQWQLIVSIILGIVSIALTHYLYQRYKQPLNSEEHSNV